MCAYNGRGNPKYIEVDPDLSDWKVRHTTTKGEKKVRFNDVQKKKKLGKGR